MKNLPQTSITVLDFDDTLAITNSKIIVTLNNNVTKINATQFALQHQSLEKQGAKFNFSEFNKVIGGKTAPLFQKALKLQSKFSSKDMFVLTARPANAAKAIHVFLKANGLNIPLNNIVGLEDGKPEAKSLWIANKVAEGYNDFYFADDALKNVQAVKNTLKQLNVKSKVQQALVDYKINI